MSEKHFLRFCGGAFVLMMFLVFAIGAKAQTPQRVMLCDTADQLKAVYTLHLEGEMDLNAAAAMVNGITNACGIVAVIAEIEEQVEEVPISGHTFIVLRVKVMGFVGRTPVGMQFIPADGLIQYAIMPKSKGQDA